MAQLKTPPAPVSKSVQRLLAQIHTEAEADILAALSAKDGVVVLQPMPIEHRKVSACGTRGFEVESSDGSELRFFITHEVDSARLIGPRWSAYQSLTDGQGRKWGRYLGFDYITDDFGNLVNAEGGAT